MDKLSNLLHTSETFRRELLTGLGIWLCLELVAFAVFPGLGIIQLGDRLKGWLALSFVFGLGGAFLLALCPRYIECDRQRSNKIARHLRIGLWRLMAWAGLAGVAFPLLMLSYELFTQLFDQLIEG